MAWNSPFAPNPFVNLAYLAAKTSKIRLGTGTVVARSGTPSSWPVKSA
jgi:alkanesulfonate monooxygenase SsuD/methylene tetrahydromethanopterin reductase-like flavin-dependent oxidoreductase (luciferase family)